MLLAKVGEMGASAPDDHIDGEDREPPPPPRGAGRGPWIVLLGVPGLLWLLLAVAVQELSAGGVAVGVAVTAITAYLIGLGWTNGAGQPIRRLPPLAVPVAVPVSLFLGLITAHGVGEGQPMVVLGLATIFPLLAAMGAQLAGRAGAALRGRRRHG